MEFTLISLLNGLSYGLLLFMLASGLTLIFSMMGVLNFAHASFYMLGAYFAYALSGQVGFWPALLLAPFAVGVTGAVFERGVLRKAYIDLQAYYESNAAEAAKLIRVGESKPDAKIPPAELAAWTMLANNVLNLDEALNK